MEVFQLAREELSPFIQKMENPENGFRQLEEVMGLLAGPNEALTGSE